VAGLLADLKGRGLLKDTLVVFTTEFGRSPGPEGAMGRGHYNRAFSSWLAGGGVKGGMAYGKTDDFGFRIVENECHVHDFHATILHCLGFDHTKLTFRHAGRDYRLTDVAGSVVKEILVG
jgi:arylsulfatase A-like enzyme